MKERPILFSAPMVRAILGGGKTQTRRIVKKQPAGAWAAPGKTACPYGQPGDRLWVRETWSIDAFGGSHGPDGFGRWDYQVKYRADNATKDLIYKGDYRSDPYCGLFDTQMGDWRPSIHMFRWASRIDLLIKSVRVERLQDISEADCWAEGIEQVDGMLDDLAICNMAKHMGLSFEDPAPTFAALWESINGAGSWEDNPWVWVISFERVKP